jgi:hypothetical protein
MKLSVEWFRDAAERVVLTFLIVFATTWVAAPSLDVDQAKAIVLAAFTAAVTLAKTLLAGLLTGGGSAVPSTSTAATKAI